MFLIKLYVNASKKRLGLRVPNVSVSRVQYFGLPSLKKTKDCSMRSSDGITILLDQANGIFMLKSEHYEIKLLADCQEHIPILAKLWYEEISRHWAPSASIDKAKQKLIDHLNTNNMPMAYVAICDGEAVGMACLRETDGIRPGITPWLGSLVVNPKYRGHKVGEALINTVKEQAKKLGHQILYLLAFDPTIPNWYARLGWTHIGEDELFGHCVTVMSINL